jgi:hypothetical protein
MLGRKPVRRLLGLGLATSLVLPAVARSAPAGPHLLGIRPLGMGNAFVAVCDDRNALHYNPAGLANIERWSISGLGMYGGVDDEFFEVVHFIEDNQEKFSDVDSIDQEFVDSLAPYDDRWVATDANAYIDFTRHNLGIGAYTSGRLQFKIDRGVYEPRVAFNVSDDIVGIAGVGYDLDRYDLRAGGSLKAIWRRGTERNLSAREVADFDPTEVLDDLAGSEGGFAVDLGTYWRGGESKLAAAAVLRNLGVVDGEGLAAEVHLGSSYTLFEIAAFVRRILVAADLANVFSQDEAFGNKIHLGGEVNARVLSFRAGFNQGYPSVGASVNARVFVLDYAFFGRELGEFPGSEGQYLHAVEVRFGF